MSFIIKTGLLPSGMVISKQVVLDVDREILKDYHATRLGFASLNEHEIIKATTILGAGLSEAFD